MADLMATERGALKAPGVPKSGLRLNLKRQLKYVVLRLKEERILMNTLYPLNCIILWMVMAGLLIRIQMAMMRLIYFLA